MSRGTLWIVLVAICASGITGCGGGSGTNPPPAPPPVQSQNFTFYVSGLAFDGTGDNADVDPYDIAGVVAIDMDGSGKVVAGEQDYGDGDRIASPEPQGDVIMSGSLTMQTNGQGTLTLITNNSQLGINGTETFAVAFSNANHALITQFDGSATSSGSLDLQTSTATPSGAFSFVASGLGGGDLAPIVEGGVFTVDASGNVTGMGDMSQGGQVTRGTAIPAGATLSVPDSFGRGTVTTDSIIFGTLSYYTVGPKIFRIIETELDASAVGSAYSQGTHPTFTNASIGKSAFSVGQGFDFYAAGGQFTTDPAATATFTGVGDVNQLFGALLPSAAIGGTYSLGANGYGTMTFNPIGSSPGFGDIVTLGVYAVDPTLNILDPNNTTNTAGAGGALLAEMDTNLAGIGLLIPQTDVTPADFTGAYTFGAQGRTSLNPDEFDFVGQATVTAAKFAGSGALNDLFGDLTGTAGQFPNVTFTGTATPDTDNPGRFTFTPLALSSTGFTSPVDATIVVYQANAGQLFSVQIDKTVESGGSLQQSTFAPAAGARPAKPSTLDH
jgi:hypothetical protein